MSLAACGGSDGGSTAQSQRSTVRSATVVACPDNVLCIVGDHWDTVLCSCVPNDGGAGVDASADAGPGDDGSATPDGGSEAGDEDDASSSCPGH